MCENISALETIEDQSVQAVACLKMYFCELGRNILRKTVSKYVPGLFCFVEKSRWPVFFFIKVTNFFRLLHYYYYLKLRT